MFEQCNIRQWKCHYVSIARLLSFNIIRGPAVETRLLLLRLKKSRADLLSCYLAIDFRDIILSIAPSLNYNNLVRQSTGTIIRPRRFFWEFQKRKWCKEKGINANSHNMISSSYFIYKYLYVIYEYTDRATLEVFLKDQIRNKV